MVRVVDVNGGALNLAVTKKVSEDVYEDFSKGRDPQTGDMVISRVGREFHFQKNSERKRSLGQFLIMVQLQL